MWKTVVTLMLLLVTVVPASARIAAELVGSYRMEVQGGDVLELRANGSATMNGEETRWSVSGNQLTIGDEVMQYKLKGDRLLLTIGPLQIAWKKLPAKGKGAPAGQKTKPGGNASQAPASGSDADQEAKQLLTSTAWCSFSYNQVSGTTNTSRVVFYPDGVMTMSGGAETYSKGYAGTYAGQSRSGSTMKWKLENLRMYLDQGDGNGFTDIGLEATRNSNGYVILHAGGKEYSMCK